MRKVLSGLFKLCYSLALPAIAITVAGCMVGPNYRRPVTAADGPDSFVHYAGHVSGPGLQVSDTWWENFCDDVTVRLVEKALENNYDLKAAAARVLQAQAVFIQSRSMLRPTVSYGIQRDQSKRSMKLGGPFPTKRFNFTTVNWAQNISVSYVLDLFGRLKRTEQASWEQILAAMDSEQAMKNTIIATVIKARIDAATIQKRLNIARDNIKNLTETLQVVQRRYERGLASSADVRLTSSNLEAAKSAEPELELALSKILAALDTMLGQRPGTTKSLPAGIAELPDFAPVPIGVPASLLDRRPDVRAAESMLRAGNEQIGASIAQLYPNLTLTGTYGTSGDRFGALWHNYSDTYSIITSLAQPIFNAGRLKAQIKAARARYAEQAANYANIVLKAIREVEDSLVTERQLRKKLVFTTEQLRQVRAAESISSQRYKRGIGGLLMVLEAQRRANIAEEQLAVLKSSLWTNRVNLYLALGGDWKQQKRLAKETVNK